MHRIDVTRAPRFRGMEILRFGELGLVGEGSEMPCHVQSSLLYNNG
jgi:hypothetical protein